jgi:hypothetical protein
MVNGSGLLDKCRVLKHHDKSQLRLAAMILHFIVMLLKQYDECNNEHNKRNERFDKPDQLNGHSEVSEWLKRS